MQRDDALNPGMLWVLEGEAAWAQPVGSAGRSLRRLPRHRAAVDARCRGAYPAFDAALQRPIDLRQRIAMCRQRLQPLAIPTGDEPQALALEAYVAFQSRGLPIRATRRPAAGSGARARPPAVPPALRPAGPAPAAIAMMPTPGGAWAAARFRRRIPPAIRSTGCSGRDWVRCSAGCAAASAACAPNPSTGARRSGSSSNSSWPRAPAACRWKARLSGPERRLLR